MIRELLENMEWYVPHKDSFLSASKAGGDLLPLWLAAKYPKDKRTGVGVAYQGSAFHLGMEEKFKGMESVLTEHSAEKELLGHLVTGTADLIHGQDVHDYKTTSASGYKNMRKDAKDKTSNLSVQMSTLRWLNNLEGKAYAEVFIRDFKPWHKAHPASAYQQVEVDVMGSNETEAYLAAKITDLDRYIEQDVCPPECENVMWMVYESNRVKLKCQYYCDYSSNCPYHNTKYQKAQKTKIAVGGW